MQSIRWLQIRLKLALMKKTLSQSIKWMNPFTPKDYIIWEHLHGPTSYRLKQATPQTQMIPKFINKYQMVDSTAISKRMSIYGQTIK